MSDRNRPWYIRGAGNQPAGPFTAEQLVQSWRTRAAQRRHHLLREGMLQWLPLGQVEPFASAMARAGAARGAAVARPSAPARAAADAGRCPARPRAAPSGRMDRLGDQRGIAAICARESRARYPGERRLRENLAGAAGGGCSAGGGGKRGQAGRRRPCRDDELAGRDHSRYRDTLRASRIARGHRNAARLGRRRRRRRLQDKGGEIRRIAFTREGWRTHVKSRRCSTAQQRDHWGISMDLPQEFESRVRDGLCTFGSRSG